MEPLTQKLQGERPEPLSEPATDELRAAIGRHAYEFYTCLRCYRLCTGLEMMAALGEGGSGSACPCGNAKYSPRNIGWRDYVLPQVIKYARHRFGAEADALLVEDMGSEMAAEGLDVVDRELHLRQLRTALGVRA